MRVAPRSLTVTFTVSPTISVRPPALADGPLRGLGPALGRVRGRAFDRAGAGHVAHGAEAHLGGLDRFARLGRRHVGHGHQQALAADDLAVVLVVQARQRDVLAGDVQPHVEFGPVADREGAHVLARLDAGVEQRPQLGTLLLRLPLAEAVAVREDALLRAGLLLVAAGPP